MPAIPTSAVIGVIGAGTMGAGIAQLAASAGHEVFLYEAFAGAAAKGKAGLMAGLRKLVARGKVTEEQLEAIEGHITVVDSKEAMAPAAMVIEAVIEKLDVKRSLFQELEGIVRDDTILATNTSSISVTAIACGLTRPERLVGMHFFNPATIMKLVEVISGVGTARDVAETVFATAEAWGKIAVHARSTPGFIVNRVARSYYGEALRLCEEQVADPSTLDALLSEGVGFRMGPFELMDLIGHDVNYAVSVSVYNAFYQEPRFRPSNLQEELVNAGHLGRKTGRGFYSYEVNAEKPAPSTESAVDEAAILEGFAFGGEWSGKTFSIAPTDGRPAYERAKEAGRAVIVYDFVSPMSGEGRVGFATSPDTPAQAILDFVATLAALGIKATRLPDWPGLVATRIVATLANEGFETVLQGVATEHDVDSAMRYGVNYPRGPMESARSIGLGRVLAVLDHLHRLTGDPRYRASFGLRTAAQSAAARA